MGTRFGTVGNLGPGRALKPAIKVANRGFVVDETFRQQTEDNKARFSNFTSTQQLFLPGGESPAVGSIFKNPELAATYRLLAKEGTSAFYNGPLAEEIAATVQAPPKVAEPTLPVPVGFMTAQDLADYKVLNQDPTHMKYRGYDVYGMAPSSSGGTTVGEALNILEPYNLSEMQPADALHHYFEASALRSPTVAPTWVTPRPLMFLRTSCWTRPSARNALA